MNKNYLYLIFLCLSTLISAQSITCPPDKVFELVDVPSDKDFGQAQVNGTVDYKIVKREEYIYPKVSCQPDSLVLIKTIYELVVNNVLKASCSQEVLVKRLRESDIKFPEENLDYENDDVSVFSLERSGRVYPNPLVDLEFNSNVLIEYEDSIVSLDPEIILNRKHIVLDWCALNTKVLNQRITLRQPKTIEIELQNISGDKLNLLNYKIQSSAVCQDYKDNESKLITCELLKNGNLLIDSILKEDITVRPSALDLVFIQRHILNIKKFDFCWQYYAADVNKDKKVTASDMVVIRKWILGLNQPDSQKDVTILPLKFATLPFTNNNVSYPFSNFKWVKERHLESVKNGRYVLTAIPSGKVKY